MRNELSDAIELGKIIAPYCFFGNFLDTYDPTRDYSANKVMFYGGRSDISAVFSIQNLQGR